MRYINDSEISTRLRNEVIEILAEAGPPVGGLQNVALAISDLEFDSNTRIPQFSGQTGAIERETFIMFYDRRARTTAWLAQPQFHGVWPFDYHHGDDI
jgi:hypothetical protein